MPLETEAPIEVRAANTNTAPSSSAVASVQPAPQAEEASPIIVPLPVRPRPATGSAPQFASATEARPQAAGVATDGALRPASDEQEMVDVLLSRETAKFRVPVSKATLPVSLFPAQDDADAPAFGGGAVIETPATHSDGSFAGASPDDELDGLARLAGRLRPALPGA
jgi:hypothetical protein